MNNRDIVRTALIIAIGSSLIVALLQLLMGIEIRRIIINLLISTFALFVVLVFMLKVTTKRPTK